MTLNSNFRAKVIRAIISNRNHYGGTDQSYAKSLGINAAIYSRIKKGEKKNLLSDGEYIRLAMRFNINPKQDNWKTVETEVWNHIAKDIAFCQRHSKAMILADIPGIGKSYCSKRIVKKIRNGFYLDCAQTKTKSEFVRSLAEVVGAGGEGRLIDVKERLKYTLNILENPIIVLDDPGYMENSAFLMIHEFWNGTEGRCGWYMLGDEALEAKITRGVQRNRIGYDAIFSRFSQDYNKLLPLGKEDRDIFIAQLVGDIAHAQLNDSQAVNKIVNKCLSNRKTLRNIDIIIKKQQDGANN